MGSKTIFQGELSPIEIELRDKLIERGIKECKYLLKIQDSKDMYFFYEGSIEGFEECRKLSSFEAYDKRWREIMFEEVREIACSLKGDDENTKNLKEKYHIFDPNEKMDIGRVWKLKGKSAQIGFIHNQLNLFRALYNNAEQNFNLEDFLGN